ncbi:hypothetical protein EX895_005647 [Sporisorium graminicola]|uniref:RRM domain-containing protein n=1 Tax=Sporisorium graminicola TaxID=280036 RepID=A0A4U7KMC0_9BASI|nr:hypothetical protein EX895_005647 [Sporisorium graminicola]TKY85485.1 hypothetical protein EX895_005647 [Sporisorium graminicola]
MACPIATTARLNNGKRISVAKEARRPRVLAPATPWRPRISRKMSAATIEDRPEHPSPLERKAGSHKVNLKLGATSEPCMVSSAPTSATLAAGGEKKESPKPTVLVGDAYRHAESAMTGAPKLEQGEDWRGDRWGSLRSSTSSSIAPAFDRADALRHEQRAFNPPPGLGLGLGEAPYHASARRAERCWALDTNNETNVYVNGLPKDMNDQMLYLLGSACGVVISHKAMMDRQSGLCKGFGFLMYASSEMAKKAIEWLNTHGFAASFAQESLSARLRRMTDNSTTNVYLSNLPIKFTTQQLEQLFSPYPIASLKILYDIHGESRGVGFVRLFDRMTAKLCIERLHGRILPGTTLPLQVRFADSEGQKQLKHSVSQKHTLESLGLLHRESQVQAHGAEQAGVGLHRGLERMRTASEIDATAAQARHIAATASTFLPTRFPQPYVPVIPSLPLHDGHSALANEHCAQSMTSLGIQMPGAAMWPLTHVGPHAHAGMHSLVSTAAGVVYSGPERHYALSRPYAVSPLIAGTWDGGKPQDGVADPAYLPMTFIPPPGLTLAAAEDTRDDPPRTIAASHSRSQHARHRATKAPVRVRFPATAASSGTGTESAQRAVSDPMAMLAAQARVRQALGMRDRVRAAVSADNSIDEDAVHSHMAADASIVSSNGTSGHNTDSEEEDVEEEEDSLSVDIQIDPR